MRWKGAGLAVLRWMIWILMAFVLVRGMVTLLPAEALPLDEQAAALAKTAPEPAGLRAFPAMFAREYLAWQPGQADDRAARLRPYLTPGLDPQAGWSSGRSDTGQAAEGAWVYSIKQVSATRWLATVAVQATPYWEAVDFDASGARRVTRTALPRSLIHLAVPVSVGPGGALAVYDYPTLLPVPQPAAADGPLLAGEQVADRDDRVKGLLSGFFRAYFGAGEGEISYYLAPDARLAKFAGQVRLESIVGSALVKSGDQVWALAEVVVSDPATGSRFTYRYTAQVVEVSGRWYIKDLLQKGD